MQNDTEEVVILIAWHNESDKDKIQAFEENRLTFIKHNPGVKIFTVFNPYKDKELAWLSTDLAFFKWYHENKTRILSKRYVLVEWDCWCDCSVFEYYKRVWDVDVVVPCVKYPERDNWYWFYEIRNLPIRARAHAMGVVPFCAIMMSQKAMDDISVEILKPEYHRLNSELRFGTVASLLHLDPIVNPVYSRSLNWREPKFGEKYKGFHHPRKAL